MYLVIYEHEISHTFLWNVKCKNLFFFSPQGIFRMEEHSDVYIWGKKQYVLNFLKIKEGSGEEEG